MKAAVIFFLLFLRREPALCIAAVSEKYKAYRSDSNEVYIFRHIDEAICNSVHINTGVGQFTNDPAVQVFLPIRQKTQANHSQKNGP